MTVQGIKWLVYDLLRKGTEDSEVIEELKARGATYDDLVRYIIEQGN